MRRKKTKERHDSLFSVGLLSPFLLMLGMVLGAASRSGGYMGWLASPLHALGIPVLSDFALDLIGAGIALVFVVAAIVLANKAKRSLQGRRDFEIRKPGPKALYLRPFFTDKRIQVPNPFYSIPLGGASLEPQNILPEEFIGRVLEPHIGVMEIGGDPKSISNGKIYSGSEDWRDSFRQAVESASAIIVLPMIGLDSKTGRVLGETTLWELCYLVESRQIARTIIVMPRVGWPRRRYARQSWERARVAAAGFGLIIPEFRKYGSVVLLKESQGCWVVAREFLDVKNGRNGLAAGLVEALSELAGRYGFELLNRSMASHLQDFR